jgi:hypothetical protein
MDMAVKREVMVPLLGIEPWLPSLLEEIFVICLDKW